MALQQWRKGSLKFSQRPSGGLRSKLVCPYGNPGTFI